MNIVYIPVAFVVIMLLFPVTAPQSLTAEEQLEAGPNTVVFKVENPEIDEEADYASIHEYISRTYKRVSSQDAIEISKRLVEYGKKYKIDPKFVAALMARESSFNREAVSSTGAKGLGQIKDFNYSSLRISDPLIFLKMRRVHLNILSGCLESGRVRATKCHWL